MATSLPRIRSCASGSLVCARLLGARLPGGHFGPRGFHPYFLIGNSATAEDSSARDSSARHDGRIRRAGRNRRPIASTGPMSLNRHCDELSGELPCKGQEAEMAPVELSTVIVTFRSMVRRSDIASPGWRSA